MSLGHQVFGGIKKGAAWRTAVALGSGNGFLFNTISGKVGRELIPNPSLGHGRVTPLPGWAGKHQAQQAIAMVLQYGGYNIKKFIAGVMGATAGVGSTVDTSAKKHVISLADLKGLFWTFAYEIDKDAEVWEFPSIKLLGLTIAGEVGKECTLTVRFLASRVITDDSGTNKVSTIDSVTLPTGGEYAVLGSHGSLLVNAQGGGALTAPSGGSLNDGVPFSSFEFSIDRKLRIGKFTTEHGDEHAEPQAGELTEVRLNIKLDEYGAANRGSQLVADNLAKTAKKGKLVFTSPELAGAATQAYQFGIHMPYLLVPEGAPEVNDAGEPKWDLTYLCHGAASAPTGFSYTDTTIEIHDRDSANPLA